LAALDELTADERRALGLVADRLGRQRAAASGAHLSLRPRPRPLHISD
jgi:hypothetical protein